PDQFRSGCGLRKKDFIRDHADDRYNREWLSGRGAGFWSGPAARLPGQRGEQHVQPERKDQNDAPVHRPPPVSASGGWPPTRSGQRPASARYSSQAAGGSVDCTARSASSWMNCRISNFSHSSISPLVTTLRVSSIVAWRMSWTTIARSTGSSW